MRPVPPPSSAYYDLHGRCIEVGWDVPSVAEALHLILDYFGLRRSKPAAPRVDARVAFLTDAPPLSVPDEAEPVISRNGLDVWRLGSQVFFREGPSLARLDLDQSVGRAVVRVPVWNQRGLLRTAFVNFVIHSLLVLLRRHALYPLHGAALAYEDAGLLLVGDSDSGKSTQAMSLVRQGWSYLSDDSLLLHPTPDGIEARPLRREFGMDAESALLFPEIAAHWRPYLTSERKRRIDMAALFPEQARTGCLPRLLLFPKIEPGPESRLVPVSPRDVVSVLAGQSPLLPLTPALTLAHLDVLERLSAQAPAYRLLASRDLKEDPARLAGLLMPYLDSEAVHHRRPAWA